MVIPVWVRRPPDGPRLVHVNSTAVGGGVAEVLQALSPAQAAAGVPVGWAVINGTPEFFDLTKHLHHLLHDKGDPAVLDDPAAAATYRSVLAPQAEWLAAQLTAGDVAVLHDPQTLGLAPRLARNGVKVVWHCHIGTTASDAAGPAAVWRWFDAALSAVDCVVTTLAEFAPPGRKSYVCAPAIGPKSPKNRELTDAEVAAIVAGGVGAVVEESRPVPAGARVVAQVSRWDPLKDMPGVVRCLPDLPADTHLVLVGNNPAEIPDDPEGFAVLDQVRAEMCQLDEEVRDRVHLVLTSSRDRDDAAMLVNAWQRRADVVLQKSLEEGFGLTVTEAMLKGRAVVAADVGGLRVQISHGETGLLVDPTDRAQVVAALRSLLDDPKLRTTMGKRAAEAAAARYTIDRLVRDYQTFAEVGVDR